jgi:hypothetical protein
MKLKNRIIFDFFILLIFILLQSGKNIDITAHEILGITFAALILLHCIINRKWIIKIHKSKKTKLFINLVFFAAVLATVCSGIMQSELHFSSNNYEMWHHMHAGSTRVMICAAVLHILNHRKMIATAILRRLPQSREAS